MLKGFNIGVVEKMFEEQAMSDGQYREVMIPTNDGRDKKRQSFAQRRKSSVLSRLSTGSGGSVKRRQVAQQRWATAISLARERVDQIGKASQQSETQNLSLQDLRKKVMKEEEDEQPTTEQPSEPRVEISEPDLKRTVIQESAESQKETESMPEVKKPQQESLESKKEEPLETKVDLEPTKAVDDIEPQQDPTEPSPDEAKPEQIDDAQKEDDDDLERKEILIPVPVPCEPGPDEAKPEEVDDAQKEHDDDLERKEIVIPVPVPTDDPDRKQAMSESSDQADDSSRSESPRAPLFADDGERDGGGDPLAEVTVIPRGSSEEEPRKWI